jgi:hypothetical protein
MQDRRAKVVDRLEGKNVTERGVIAAGSIM